MNGDSEQSVFIHDIFISYSRKDIDFARSLEKALENYSPPGNLSVPPRRLDVFRDENDFTGVEYNQSLHDHLKTSRKLLVICSPFARGSNYVNDEIRLFAELRGAKNIIPVLFSGIPNNKATPDQEDQKAFPASLCEVMKMPLAADFTDIDAARDKVYKGIFKGPWFAILANIYGVTRSEIEQRERKRKKRRRMIWSLFIAGIFIVLSSALVIALIERNKAIMQRNRADSALKDAVAGKLAAEALYENNRNLDLSLLLANASTKVKLTSENQNTLLYTLLFQPQLDHFLCHACAFSDLVFSPDGNVLASGATMVWDEISGRPAGMPEGKYDRLQGSTAFSPAGKLLAYTEPAENGYKISLMDLTSGKLLQPPLPEYQGLPVNLTFNPDGNLLVSAVIDLESSDDVLKVIFYDVAGRKIVGEVPTGVHVANPWKSAVFSSDGTTLAVAGEKDEITFWDVGRREFLQRSLSFAPEEVMSVAFSSDGRMLAAGCINGRILLWDVASGRPLGAPPKVDDAPIFSIAFSTDGRTLAFGAYSGEIYRWDIGSQTMAGKALKGHTSPAISLAFSRDGAYLASSSEKKAILWRMDLASQLRIFAKKFNAAIWSLVFNPDGKTLTIASLDTTIDRLDLEHGKSIDYMPGVYSGNCECLAVSSDTKLAAFKKNSNEIGIYDLEHQKFLAQTLKARNFSSCHLAIAPDGEMLVYTDGMGMFSWHITRSPGSDEQIFDVDKANEHFGAILSVAFSSDGNRLALGSNGGSIYVLQKVNHRYFNLYQKLENPDFGTTLSLSFSRDGNILAAADAVGQIVLWDVAGAKKMGKPLQASRMNIFSLAFNSDGRVLAAGDAGGAVTLWDVERQKMIGLPIQASAELIRSIAISPDGHTLAAGTDDGEISLWDLKLASWQELACRMAGRNLSCAELQQYLGGGFFESFKNLCPDYPQPDCSQYHE